MSVQILVQFHLVELYIQLYNHENHDMQVALPEKPGHYRYPWEPWVSVPNFMAIHPRGVKIFQSGPSGGANIFSLNVNLYMLKSQTGIIKLYYNKKICLCCCCCCVPFQ